MKKRIMAIALTLTVLSGMIAIQPAASANPASLVRATRISFLRGPNPWAIGNNIVLQVEVEFPNLANNPHGFNFATLQTLSLELSGTRFALAGLVGAYMPFANATLSDVDDTSASFELPLIATSTGGGQLVFSLTHDQPPAGSGNVMSSSFQFGLTPNDPPEPPPLPPGDGNIPDPPPRPARFTVSGTVPRLTAGTAGNIQFRLQNDSGFAVRNLHISLNGGEELLRPTSIAGIDIAIGSMPSGAAGARNITIPVNVLPDAPGGYHQLELALTMLNAAGESINTTVNIRIFVHNPAAETVAGTPVLTLASATVNTNSPGPDGLITLTLTVANIGDGTASNARISLSGFSATTIMLNEDVVTKLLGDIAAGGRSTVTYSLRVSNELDAGVRSLGVEVRYRTPQNEDGSMEDSAHINIVRPLVSDANVALHAISQNTSNPGPSNIITLTLTIQNRGDTTAENVTVGLRNLSASAFTLAGSFGDRTLGNLAPGQSITETIAIHASQSLPNGNHPLDIMIQSANYGSTETQVFISVNRPEINDDPPDLTPGGTPRVIISRHYLSVDTVNAGSPFDLTVTLLNTSANRNIRNMIVSITDPDGIFIPVAGVSSFYIPSLPIGQTTDVVISLVPKADAESRSFPVVVRLDYEDEHERDFTVTSSLNIPVVQPHRLEVMNLSFFDNFRGGADLSFQFVNMGRAALNNFNVRIEGDLMAAEGAYFVGTFNAGAFDFFDDMIFTLGDFGEVSGEIVFEFEDSAGVSHEVRHAISTWINEPFVPEFPGGDRWPEEMWPEEDLDSDSIFTQWWFLVIVGVVVVAGVITTVAVLKKKKLRKMELEDYE